MNVRVRLIPVHYIAALGAALAVEIAAAARGSAALITLSDLITLAGSVSYSVDAFIETTGYHQPYSFERAIDLTAKWYLASHS